MVDDLEPLPAGSDMKRTPSSSKKASRAGVPRGRRAASNLVPVGYRELLDDLKARVRATQLQAALAANRELVQLYWDIGRMIVERQESFYLAYRPEGAILSQAVIELQKIG